jgi:hypothetical protein
LPRPILPPNRRKSHKPRRGLHRNIPHCLHHLGIKIS